MRLCICDTRRGSDDCQWAISSSERFLIEYLRLFYGKARYTFIVGEQMHTVTVFHGSVVAQEQLNGIFAEHQALEHLRVFRRLLAVRCAGAILVIVLAGAGFGWLPTPAWIACVVIFSVTPACVWLAERRRERHLTRRLQGVPGATTQAFGAHDST
jgi:hypothetical protein